MNRLEIVICVIVFLGFACFFIPNVEQSRGEARKAQCLNNMRNVGVGIQSYLTNERGQMPVTSPGDPPHSWRVHLVPYMEPSLLYERYQFELPWDDPGNEEFRKQGVSYYGCPSLPVDSSPDGFYFTTQAAITGTDAMWGRTKSLSINEVALADGLTQTLILVEAARQNIFWTEPRDVDLDTMTIGVQTRKSKGNSKTLISSYHTGIANVMFADGSGRQLSDGIDPVVLKKLCTATGGEKIVERF